MLAPSRPIGQDTHIKFPSSRSPAKQAPAIRRALATGRHLLTCTRPREWEWEASPLSWRNGPGQRTQSLADGDALRLIQPEKRAPQSGPARLQQAAAAPAASPGRHLCGSVRSAMSATEGWGDRAPRALLESASVLTHLEVVVSS